MEFENMNTADSDLTSPEAVELRDLLAEFRRLHESQLLRDSLMCYNRAKESFEKVDSMLGQGALGCADQASPAGSQAVVRSNSRSLREKIVAFNKASVIGENMLQNFTHCFSDLKSSNLASTDEMKASSIASRTQSNSRYEGDVDSDIDHIADEQDSKNE